MPSVIRFSCKFCGQEINIPAPSQVGIYSITCPHCQKQMKVQYTPKPITLASAPNVSSTPSSVEMERVRHTPTRHFNSPEDLLEKSSSRSSRSSSGIGRLSMVRIKKEKEYFPLHIGENSIGRKDPTQPSDIEIGGDDTMSRRSVLITVSAHMEGYSYSLTVLKCANPVLVNGSPVPVGQTVSLAVGASLFMGQTMLRLEI